MPRRKSRRGKRYSAAQKSQILQTARRQNLTAQQVQKRFGVSPLTFYRWRGPVRRRRRNGSTASANPMGTGSTLRAQVREGIRRVLPTVMREEVGAFLQDILGNGGRRRRGRPRGRRTRTRR